MKKINSRSNDSRSMLKLKKEIIKGISSHEEDIKVLVFDSTGEWLASGGWDGLLKLWNVAKGHLQWTKGLFSEAVAAISFIDAPQKNVVAISLEDTDVHCYDLISGNQQWVMDINELQPEYISIFRNKMNQTCWITPAPFLEKKFHFTLFNLHTREKQLINLKYLAKERLKSSEYIDIVSLDPLIAILTVFKELEDQNQYSIPDNELIIYDLDHNELIVSESIRKGEVYGLISSQETNKVILAFVAEQEHVLELWNYNIKEKALLKTDTISWRRRESWLMDEEIKHFSWLVTGKKVIVIETDNQVRIVNLQDNKFSRVEKVSSWKDFIPIKNNKLRALSKKSVVSAISISVDRKIAVANDKGAIAVGTMEGLTDLLSKGEQKDEETESIAFTWNKGGDKLVYCTGVDSQEVVVVSTGKEITIETLSCRKAFSGVNLPIIDIFWDCNNRLIFVTADRIIFTRLQKGKVRLIWTFKAPVGNYIEDITMNLLRTILVCSLKQTFSESMLLFFNLKKSTPT